MRQTTALAEFLSTPSARRATKLPVPGFFLASISIHALREEGDLKIYKDCKHTLISIHALREEGDRNRSAGAG